MTDRPKPGDRRAGQCSTCGYETTVVASEVSNWRTDRSIDYRGELIIRRFKPPDTPDTHIAWTCDVCTRSGASFAAGADPSHSSVPFLCAMGWLANYIREQATRGEKP